MSFSVNEYFRQHPKRVRPAITTKKGRKLSIQASDTHYCSPQNREGPYASVEVMVIEGPVPQAFIRHHGRRTDDGVYGWVPVSLVQKVIQQDGGVA